MLYNVYLSVLLQFDKLCDTSISWERHVNYEDTYYLKYRVDGQTVQMELVDPGLVSQVISKNIDFTSSDNCSCS